MSNTSKTRYFNEDKYSSQFHRKTSLALLAEELKALVKNLETKNEINSNDVLHPNTPFQNLIFGNYIVIFFNCESLICDFEYQNT